MNTSIFRKSSLDRVNSPEQLNEYIRVSNPGVWLVLSAVIVLLLGVIVWGFFGTMETSLTACLRVENGSAVCYVSADDIEKIKTGQTVTANGYEGTITAISLTPIEVDTSFDDCIRYLSNFSVGDFCYCADVEISGIADGVLLASVSLDSVAPISFVIH